MIIFRSRMYREELLRWSLIMVLGLWAFSSTIWAMSSREKIILVGFDSAGARLITDAKDLMLKDEALQFVKTFVDLYMNFDGGNHKDQIGRAADLMSTDLWDRSKEKLHTINLKLQSEPLTQKSEIESIDLVGDDSYEIRVLAKIAQRAGENEIRAKLTISLNRKARTESNPWQFEVREFKDELL